jgi:hypothetical protein
MSDKRDAPNYEPSEALAGHEAIAAAVKALGEFGARPSANHIARDPDEVLREFAFDLDRRVDMRRSRQLLFTEPKRIAGWARGGRFQKMIAELASEIERPLNLFTSLRGEQAANKRPSSTELARLLRAEAANRQAEAARVQAERKAEATDAQPSANELEAAMAALVADGTFSRDLASFALGGKDQEPGRDQPAQANEGSKKLKRWPSPPRPKQSVQVHFAIVLLELVERYLDIPTGLTTELTDEENPRTLKDGPIVKLGQKLAPIWGIKPPSGAAFAKAKRMLSNWRQE